MKELIPLVVTLTGIAMVAALALALVFSVTEAPIAQAELEKKLESISAVLPHFVNQPLDDSTESGGYLFYAARDESGAITALAFQATSQEGYSGTIELLAGITTDGRIISVRVLKQLETPGLGSKITTPEWIGQFNDASFENKTFEVRKDNAGSAEKPPIDAITGATISSRAVTKALRLGLEHYQKNRDAILSAINARAAAPQGDAQ